MKSKKKITAMPKIDTSEFIVNPSPASLTLVNIVKKHTWFYNSRFSSKKLIVKFAREVKLRVYIEEDYKQYYLFLKNYRLPKYSDKTAISALVHEFDQFYKKLMYNNIAIAYLHKKTKTIVSKVQTQEDIKNQMLQGLFNKTVGLKKFHKHFGHYGLNAYELTSKRFHEYSKSELLKLARKISDLKIHKKMPLEAAMKSKKVDKISILIALRELAKNRCLLIIAALRAYIEKVDPKLFNQPLV